MPTEAQFDRLFAMVAEIHTALVGRGASSSKPAATAKPATPTAARSGAAFDASNPTVKVMPKNWRGEDLRGRQYSECPPAFLGQLASMLDAFADKNEQDPERQRYAKWDRDNAAAARRWREKLQTTPAFATDGLEARP